MCLKLYGPYVGTTSARVKDCPVGVPRRLKYDPANPESCWWVAVHVDKRKSAIVRRLDDGWWEQLYSAYHLGYIHTGAFQIDDLEASEVVVERAPQTYWSDSVRLLENHAFRDDSHQSPLIAKAGSKCVKCGGPAAFTLCGCLGSNRLNRSFCKGCLEPAKCENIGYIGVCCICSCTRAELTIAVVEHREFKAQYRFMMHAGCFPTLDERAKPRTSLGDRKPLRVSVVGPTG